MAAYTKSAVNTQIQTSLRLLRLYMQRVERDLASGDRNQALANLAELNEIARRLWTNLVSTVETSDRG